MLTSRAELPLNNQNFKATFQTELHTRREHIGITGSQIVNLLGLHFIYENTQNFTETIQPLHPDMKYNLRSKLLSKMRIPIHTRNYIPKRDYFLVTGPVRRSKNRGSRCRCKMGKINLYILIH